MYSIGVFVGGFVLMAFEIVASRLFAPYFGNSLYTWSSIIGVILAGLAAGSHAGGLLADRRRDGDVLGTIFLGGAASILLVNFCFGFISKWLLSLPYPMPLLTLSVSVLLLFTPSLILGMIYPYSTRLRIRTVGDSGHVIGTMSLWSNIGSIAGALLTGFWLVPSAGVTQLNFFLCVLLILMSMSFGTCRYLVIKMAALLLVVAVCLWWTERENVMWHHRFVEKIDGVYSPLFLFRQDNAPSIVDVATSSFGYQSGLDRDNLATPVSDYLKLFATLSDLAPPTQSVLFVGGSLMSAPIALSLRHPNSHSDVIEMEPAYVPLVDLHGMGLDDRIHIYVDDARVKLQRIQASTFYDYIVLDAYSSDGTIPPHLVTREFFALIKNMLRPEGFVAMNVVGSWEGKDAELAHSVHATLKSVFPYIEVLPMQDPVQRGNIVFVAGSESLAAPLHLLLPSTTLSLDPRAIGSGDGIIFTDAYVPIEKYTPWYRPNFRLREKILFTAADLIRGY